jgi:hypothetical protein
MLAAESILRKARCNKSDTTNGMTSVSEISWKYKRRLLGNQHHSCGHHFSVELSSTKCSKSDSDS